MGFGVAGGGLRVGWLHSALRGQDQLRMSSRGSNVEGLIGLNSRGLDRLGYGFDRLG